MDFKNSFVLLFLVFLLSCKSEKEKIQERNAVVNSTITAFQKKLYKTEIDSIFDKNNFNGSISVFQNKEKLYERENGFEDFKTKSKLDSNSVFAIGSVSKQFTAVLVLLQEEAGKLKTTDKVSKYLPEFQTKDYENITIHQLLNHSSGLNDDGEKLLFKSGNGFNYSNKAFRFLGKIIEKVSGKSFDDNAKNLFQKIGMRHTFTANLFNGNHFAGANIGTPEHSEKVGDLLKHLTDFDISEPAGGILSTINDLNIWNTSLFEGKTLKEESMKKMLSKSNLRTEYVMGKVGYGYGMMMNLGTPKCFFHTGYVKGSPSLNIYYPETKTSVIILSNIADDSKNIGTIFKPHLQVKSISDVVENAAIEAKQELEKKAEK